MRKNRWWLQKRANPAPPSTRACDLMTAGPDPRNSKNTDPIAMADASEPSHDEKPFLCVTAKPLISKANDDVTQMTQDFTLSFRGRSRKESRDRDGAVIG